MPKVKLGLSRYSGYIGFLEVSVEVEKISSSGTPYYPLLHIPLEIAIRPITVQMEESVNFTLAKLEGLLFLPDNERIAEFSTQPMCHRTHGREYDFTEMLTIPIDLRRIRRMEEVRRGGDMNLNLHFCGMAWVEEKAGVLPDRVLNGLLPLRVPQSHWVQNILPNWKYGQVELVEIWFPEDYWGGLLAHGYPRMKEAVSHFDNGNDKEVLASIYGAFEVIAKKLGFENPDKNFFTKLLGDVDSEKRGKLVKLFHEFCQYLQLGRHEPKVPPVNIERKDSEFALNLARLVLSYISKLLITKQESE